MKDLDKCTCDEVLVGLAQFRPRSWGPSAWAELIAVLADTHGFGWYDLTEAVKEVITVREEIQKDD